MIDYISSTIQLIERPSTELSSHWSVETTWQEDGPMRRHKVHIKKLNFTWIIQLDTNTKTGLFERKAKYIFYRKLTGKIIMNGTTMGQSSIVIKEEESARRGLGPFPLSTPSLGLGLHLFNVCLWYTKHCLVFYIIYGITIIASWKEQNIIILLLC